MSILPLIISTLVIYIFGVQISDIYLCTYGAIFFANAILCSNIMCCVCVEECVYYIYIQCTTKEKHGEMLCLERHHLLIINVAQG